MTALVKELTEAERPALERHFLALDMEDRRLRFGQAIQDGSVRRYVRGIDFAKDAVFGVSDDELALIAVGHLARGPAEAELGVSVLPAHRERGLGGEILRRAHMHARNWGSNKLFMHCLAENGTMMHLARKQGMQIITQSGEADAWLKLPPADAASLMNEVFEQRVALFDHVLKTELHGARRAVRTLRRAARTRAAKAKPG